ncbi:MAG: hypothetical protein IJ812_09360, partial [Schwartzia sp.]|nr:hypothetical protein [Schwartzia sp. (in: firmicutes)]
YVERHLTQHDGKRPGVGRRDLFGVSLNPYCDCMRRQTRFSAAVACEAGVSKVNILFKNLTLDQYKKWQRR